MMRAWLAPVVAMALGFVVAGCSRPLVREPVNLAPARIVPGQAPVIDGYLTRPDEWAGAAEAPIDGCATARFLWSDEGLYGLVNGRGMAFAGPGGSDAISLSLVRVGEPPKHYRLYIVPGANAQGVPTVELKAVEWAGEVPTAPNAARTSWAATDLSRAADAERAPWGLEFMVRWEALGAATPPPDEVRILAYRIVCERPYSLLVMPPAPR